MKYIVYTVLHLRLQLKLNKNRSHCVLQAFPLKTPGDSNSVFNKQWRIQARTLWIRYGRLSTFALVLVLTDYFTFRANEPSLCKSHSTKTIKKWKDKLKLEWNPLVNVTLLFSFNKSNMSEKRMLMPYTQRNCTSTKVVFKETELKNIKGSVCSII